MSCQTLNMLLYYRTLGNIRVLEFCIYFWNGDSYRLVCTMLTQKIIHKRKTTSHGLKTKSRGYTLNSRTLVNICRIAKAIRFKFST